MTTAQDRGLTRALEIQRREDPKTWRARVDAIADPDERAAADAYLRGIVQRMRVIAALKRGQNPRP